MSFPCGWWKWETCYSIQTDTLMQCARADAIQRQILISTQRLLTYLGAWGNLITSTRLQSQMRSASAEHLSSVLQLQQRFLLSLHCAHGPVRTQRSTSGGFLVIFMTQNDSEPLGTAFPGH